MQKNIFVLFLLALIIPLCNYSMERKSQKGHIALDIDNLSTELGVPDIALGNVAKIKKKTNSQLIALIKNHLNNDRTIGSDLSEQDKQIVCSYLPVLKKTFPEKYTKLKQLFFETISNDSIIRGRKVHGISSKTDTSQILIEKQLMILQVIAAAFKKSAQEAEDNNKVQADQMEEAQRQNLLMAGQNRLLEESNQIMKSQNRWERKITIVCGIANVCLGFATVVLGVATAYLGAIQAANN